MASFSCDTPLKGLSSDCDRPFLTEATGGGGILVGSLNKWPDGVSGTDRRVFGTNGTPPWEKLRSSLGQIGHFLFSVCPWDGWGSS